jgi:hypothetical protein
MFCQEHVAGLEVAMDDTELVARAKACEQLLHDRDCKTLVERTLFTEKPEKGLAPEELDDEVGTRVGKPAKPQNATNVRVRDREHDARLLLEAEKGAFAVGRWPQDFDGNHRVESGVVRGVDSARCPFAEQLSNAVAVVHELARRDRFADVERRSRPARDRNLGLLVYARAERFIGRRATW